MALWRKVAETTDRIPEALRTETSIPPQEPAPKPPRLSLPDTIPNRIEGTHRKLSNDLRPSLPEQFAQAPLHMDRKTFGRMTKGRLQPEGRLDLHGMTLDRAHGALTRFILGQRSMGKRLVLVITGKGKTRDDEGPIPVRTGVLRHQVPQWLSVPPLAQAVLQVTPAHIKHGGGGAYYVYLRKGG